MKSDFNLLPPPLKINVKWLQNNTEEESISKKVNDATGTP